MSFAVESSATCSPCLMCMCILHPNSPTYNRRYRQLADRGWPLDSKAGYTLIAKYVKMGAACEKWKVYSGVFHVLFFAFHISQHFAPGPAFMGKLKGFCGLFFRGINKTRNLHEIRKVYSECFTFCGVSRTHSWNVKYEKCIAGLTVGDIFHTLFNVACLSHTLSTRFEPLYTNMYHMGPPDSTVLRYVLWLEIFGATFVYHIYESFKDL